MHPNPTKVNKSNSMGQGNHGKHITSKTPQSRNELRRPYHFELEKE